MSQQLSSGAQLAASTAAQNGHYRDPDTGHMMIPGSKRPDGSWRRPRRIKEGYVPQDEVPVYEAKGRRDTSESSHGVIPGLVVDVAKVSINSNKSSGSPGIYASNATKSSIPGLTPLANPTTVPIKSGGKKRGGAKNKKADQTSSLTANITITAATMTKTTTTSTTAANASSESSKDPSKRVRNLQKRLRDIEQLEQKLANGEIEKPEPEQIEKVGRKQQVIEEIEALQKLL